MAATGIGGAALAAATGLSVRWQEVPVQAVVLGCIGAGGVYFHVRGNQRFAETVMGMLQMLTFTVGFTVAMYAVCSLGRPLVDDRLAVCDAALGFHLPAVVAWVQRHPLAGLFLQIAYSSLLPQTLLVIAVLGLTGRHRELHGFLMPFFLSLVLVLVAFALWPAAGPFAQYGFEPSAVQRRYLDHLHGFRNGVYTVISWRAAEGLVTFPSFHTAAALLLAYALRWNRWSFVCSALVNLAVIVGTLTTGWHYLVDVLGGVALAVTAVALCRAMERWPALSVRLRLLAARRGTHGWRPVTQSPLRSAGFEKSKWLAVLAVATAGVASAPALGLQVPWRAMWSQWLMFGFAGLCAGYFYRRGNDRFLTLALALLQLTMYGAGYFIAMYAACAVARPLIDGSLMAWDAALGLRVPTVVGWIETHPALRLVLNLSYDTLLPQTMLVIVGSVAVGRSREMHQFLLGFFLCSLLALVIFAVWPAAGPFSGYGYAPSPLQQRYLEQFQAIRAGRLTDIPWPDAVGLITFPSMHTSWALLLTYAVRWSRKLWVPGAVLNLLVIVSTVTTGWHYLADVLAGVALAAATVAVCQVWEGWRWRRPAVAACPLSALGLPRLAPVAMERTPPVSVSFRQE